MRCQKICIISFIFSVCAFGTLLGLTLWNILIYEQDRYHEFITRYKKTNATCVVINLNPRVCSIKTDCQCIEFNMANLTCSSALEKHIDGLCGDGSYCCQNQCMTCYQTCYHTCYHTCIINTCIPIDSMVTCLPLPQRCNPYNCNPHQCNPYDCNCACIQSVSNRMCKIQNGVCYSPEYLYIYRPDGTNTTVEIWSRRVCNFNDIDCVDSFLDGQYVGKSNIIYYDTTDYQTIFQNRPEYYETNATIYFSVFAGIMFLTSFILLIILVRHGGFNCIRSTRMTTIQHINGPPV